MRDLHRCDRKLLDTARGCFGGQLPWPLTVIGPTGSGKTCFSLALCDWLYACEFHAFADLCDNVIQGLHGKAAHMAPDGSWSNYSTTHLWWIISRAPIAVLDDVGLRDRATPNEYKVMKTFLDARDGGPSIVTTNLSVAELEAFFDARVTSRLLKGTVHALDAPDRRLQP